MKTRGKKILVYVSMIALFFVATVAYAQPDSYCAPEGRSNMGRGMRQNFMKELDLTDEQQQQMQELRKETKERMKELREAMKENRNALHNELQKTDINTREIKKITSEIKDLQGQKIDYMVDNVIQMKEILAPEQFEKLSEMREKRKGRRGQQGSQRSHRQKSQWGRF